MIIYTKLFLESIKTTLSKYLNMFYKVMTLAYYVLTPLHVGSGRGGKVDIVIQRDSFGIPIVYASSIKGTIKSTPYRSDKPLWEVFGSEVSFRYHEDESYVVFTDAYPLAFPISHEKYLIHYVTSPYLLKKACDILEVSQHPALGKVEEIFNKVRDLKDYAIPLKESKITKGIECIYTREKKLDLKINEALNVDFPIEFKGASYPIIRLSDSLIIIPDKFMIKLLDEKILTSTRIAIDYNLKTTRRGALWTEEYVPAGTIFIGTVLFKKEINGKEVPKEKIEDLEKLFRNGIIVILGGKETVGKGFVKIIAID